MGLCSGEKRKRAFKTIIIPRGIIDPNEHNIIEIPLNLDTNSSLIVKAPTDANSCFSVEPYRGEIPNANHPMSNFLPNVNYATNTLIPGTASSTYGTSYDGPCAQSYNIAPNVKVDFSCQTQPPPCSSNYPQSIPVQTQAIAVQTPPPITQVTSFPQPPTPCSYPQKVTVQSAPPPTVNSFPQPPTPCSYPQKVTVQSAPPPTVSSYPAVPTPCYPQRIAQPQKIFQTAQPPTVCSYPQKVSVQSVPCQTQRSFGFQTSTPYLDPHSPVCPICARASCRFNTVSKLPSLGPCFSTRYNQFSSPFFGTSTTPVTRNYPPFCYEYCPGPTSDSFYKKNPQQSEDAVLSKMLDDKIDKIIKPVLFSIAKSTIDDDEREIGQKPSFTFKESCLSMPRRYSREYFHCLKPDSDSYSSDERRKSCPYFEPCFKGTDTSSRNSDDDDDFRKERRRRDDRLDSYVPTRRVSADRDETSGLRKTGSYFSCQRRPNNVTFGENSDKDDDNKLDPNINTVLNTGLKRDHNVSTILNTGFLASDSEADLIRSIK